MSHAGKAHAPAFPHGREPSSHTQKRLTLKADLRRAVDGASYEEEHRHYQERWAGRGATRGSNSEQHSYPIPSSRNADY
jgi:hypothetical protein